MTQYDPRGPVPPPMQAYPPGAYSLPPQVAYQPPPATNGLAVAALVLGLLGLLGGWIPFVGLVGAAVALVGLILGLIAFFRARSAPEQGRGMALAGSIISLVALVVSITITTMAARWVGEVTEQFNAARAKADAEAAAQKAAADKAEQAERQALGLPPFRIKEERDDSTFKSGATNHWMTIVASGDLTTDNVFAAIDYLKSKNKAPMFHLKVLADEPKAPGRTFLLYNSQLDDNREKVQNRVAQYRKLAGLQAEK